MPASHAKPSEGAARAFHGAADVHADFPAAALSPACLSPAEMSTSPAWAAPTGPLQLQALRAAPPHPHPLPLILPRAQSSALTLLAGFQLLHLQVMGELWKRNQRGLRRGIPAVPRAPGVSPARRRGCRGPGNRGGCGTAVPGPRCLAICVLLSSLQV